MSERLKSSPLSAFILVFAAIGSWGFTDRADASLAAPSSPVPAVVVEVCSACHGIRGNSMIPSVPSLAGQGSPYLERQLAAFQAQRRVGVMSGVAMNLSDADIRDAARYFSQQIPRPRFTRSIDRQAPARGERIFRDGIANKSVPSCASCHALDGQGLPPAFPSLAAQHATYLAAQLRAFRDDRRISNTNAMMRSVAAPLSDTEIDAVAGYIADMR